MYTKNSALFLSIALLFSTVSVVADEAPKADVSYAQKAKNAACGAAAAVKGYTIDPLWNEGKVWDAKGFSWTELARNTARLAIVTGAFVGLYSGLIKKSNKKQKAAKPRATRSEAAVTTVS